MKLKFDVQNQCQPDPFIFKDDDGTLYLYTTGSDGIHAYSAKKLTDIWHYEGIILSVPTRMEYWAPSVIKLDGKYYIYFSYALKNQYMHVAVSDSPLGPFEKLTCLYDRFTIDSHVVKTDAGLYLWYAEDDLNDTRRGTRVFVDKLIDPFTPAGICKEMISPSYDEEIFTIFADGPWHTLEGPFWFKEGDWQYVMYSGGAYKDDSYHIGYAAVRSDEEDLLKLALVKHTKDGKFDPVMFRHGNEEGVGHHSVIKLDGEYYAIYHARDGVENKRPHDQYIEERTARFCKLHVKDGVITAEYLDD